MKRSWALVLVVVAGCTSPNPTKHCADGMCLNPDFPYCDVEGVVSGEPGTCIAVSCMPGEIRTCLGEDAFTCAATGDGYERVACDLGCSATPKPHCKYIEPRYLPDICDALAPDEYLEVTSSGSLDPNLDSNCNGGVVPQEGAPSICVVRYRRISIAAGVTLKITGTTEGAAGRAIALVADDRLAVDGTLDISADGVINGPGGGVTTSGGQPLVTDASTHVAGGGAGGKTPGAAGGSSSADGGAANGGAAMVEPALLAALMGGSAGSRSGPLGTTTLASGGGGGAIALIACRGSVIVSGTIDAGGGGGAEGIYLPFPGVGLPGHGGGAGGNVVLLGVHISVTGQVFANGGGGGGGMQSSQLSGVAGQDGSSSATSPAKGGSPQGGEGRGGAGGIGTAPPTVGGKPTMSPATAGGGGGSVGTLQTYTPTGIEPTLAPTAVSPAFQPNRAIMTR